MPFEIVPAAVDEAAVKAGMLAEAAPPRDVADALAELKARRVAARHPERLVLGADQVLFCGGRIYDKPRDLGEARAQLASLRGQRHELLSAAVVFENAAPVWRHVGRRPARPCGPSPTPSSTHMSRTEGAAILATVGAYRLEDGGAQLFARVEGDLFTIIGLPLLELLAFLRTRGIVPRMTGQPLLAGVIGWPIGHSRSPRLHGHWLRRYGIDGYYIPIGLPPEGFAAGLRAAQASASAASTSPSRTRRRRSRSPPRPATAPARSARPTR